MQCILKRDFILSTFLLSRFIIHNAVAKFSILLSPNITLRLLDTYAAKTHEKHTPWHVSLINSAAKHLSKICILPSLQQWLILGMLSNGGCAFHVFLQHKCVVTLVMIFKYCSPRNLSVCL